MIWYVLPPVILIFWTFEMYINGGGFFHCLNFSTESMKGKAKNLLLLLLIKKKKKGRKEFLLLSILLQRCSNPQTLIALMYKHL